MISTKCRITLRRRRGGGLEGGFHWSGGGTERTDGDDGRTYGRAKVHPAPPPPRTSEATAAAGDLLDRPPRVSDDRSPGLSVSNGRLEILPEEARSVNRNE